ncbi:beta-lactamase family protein [Erythrobacter sp. SDW2]|uniref:serine hydrolase domain-containing protein n=1 Tax=Erythrobacter sp. SDW2 TaxID=2907154 RepID=UPI001F2EF890|nr:serine hydrolase domain-containing protein [Erythrobacter sp. SDW2]UIP05817.1 beta-lactamase family protein [Erythrobacter sp. SDW2]
MILRLATLGAVAFLGTDRVQAEATDPATAAAISQAMLDAAQEVSGVPGLSAAVWRSGSVVWTGTAGSRDLEQALPVERDTRFRLASVSKLVTVTALAKLAEEGRIDLDAPIASILPWLENDWPAITARQLAAHSSGLPHYQDVDVGRGAMRYSSGRAAVAIFSDRSLLSEPGTQYSYSSWGYTLLGALIEEVTGQSFESYFASAITHGLDLGLDTTDTDDPKATRAYEFVGGQAQPALSHDYSYTWGGGGLMASVEGLVRFGGAMLQDRIVSKATFDAMTQPFVLASGQTAGDAGYDVGFGWRIAEDGDGNPITFHNGTAIGARSSLVLWREENTAAAILSNASWTSSIDSTSQMLAAPFRDAPPGLIPAACPVQSSQFAGTLSGEPVSGVARFRMVDGVCQGELEIGGTLRTYFDRGPQPTAPKMRIVGIGIDGGLSRAGLVTPFGIYEIRATEDGQFHSEWSSTRNLTFRLLEQGEGGL